jgi:hypothetical protein
VQNSSTNPILKLVALIGRLPQRNTLYCCECISFSDGRDGSTCQAACLNGGTCSGSKCVCRPGYQGEFCGERKFIIVYTYIH